MTQNPKVSIIIPVYNGSNFVRHAIDCALSQTYDNVEVVVVNDGSTDGGKTEEIALSYGDRIRYFAKENGGVSSALNYGIANMTGEYFSWLSHDDAYGPDKVKDAIKLLRAHDMLGKKCVAHTSGYTMDVDGNKLKDFPNSFAENQVFSGVEVLTRMTKERGLYGCCMLIPKSAFDEVGGFAEDLRFSQDFLMWYRIFMAGYQLVSDHRLNVMCRLHKNQVTNLRRDLYEHDAVIIAKLLAEPLVNVDADGTLLMLYLQRLTKYQCKEAIAYIRNFAAEKGLMTPKRRVAYYLYQCKGFFRYRLATFAKKHLYKR